MDRKQDGKYDYSGAWTGETRNKTVSVGIFKWISNCDGKRLRKTAVIHRVKGQVAEYKQICAEAERICDLLDARDAVDTRTVAEFLGHKTTTVR